MTDWLIENRVPLGIRVADIAPEGSNKTMKGTCRVVCVASGTNECGRKVLQGPALIVDMETPIVALENWLDRFAQGAGYDTYKKLPITIYKDEFEFGRKGALDKLKKAVIKIKPVFIRLDSLTPMAPLGLRGKHENDSTLGNIIGRDLREILDLTDFRCTTQLAIHTKKDVADLNLEQVESLEAQQLARGSGSIIGEGSDLALAYKKISEHPEPTRFTEVSKVRRLPIPDHRTRLIELEEEKYGEGWARLKEISFEELPPSEYARDVYQCILTRRLENKEPVKARAIHYDLANFSRAECRAGITELLKRRVILNGVGPQCYILNPDRAAVVNANYLKKLAGK